MGGIRLEKPSIYAGRDGLQERENSDENAKSLLPTMKPIE